MGNQRVFLPVQEENRALSIRYEVDVSEAFIHNHCQEACPTQQVFRCVLDAHIRRHEQQRVSIFAGRQVARRPAAHTSSKKNYVAFFDAHHLGQVIVDCISIVLHFLFIRARSFIKTVARVLNGQNMHLHLSAEHVEQVKGQSNILCVTVEIYDHFVATIFAWKVQAGYVLDIMIFDLARLLLLLNRRASLRSPRKVICATLARFLFLAWRLLVRICISLILQAIFR